MPYIWAARANKVARLRAACVRQLGEKDFSAVHGFLRSVRRREAERAGVSAAGAVSSRSRRSSPQSNGTSLVAIAAAAADIGGDDDDDGVGGGGGGGGSRMRASAASVDGLLSETEVTSHLLTLVRGDESKMAACYAVDMLCFEERLFLDGGEGGSGSGNALSPDDD